MLIPITFAEPMFANDPRRHPDDWRYFVALAPKIGVAVDALRSETWLQPWNCFLEGMRYARHTNPDGKKEVPT